jgi:hypothetical protein
MYNSIGFLEFRKSFPLTENAGNTWLKSVGLKVLSVLVVVALTIISIELATFLNANNVVIKYL